MTVTIHAAGLALVIAAAAIAGAGVARLGGGGSRYHFSSWNGETVRIDRKTGAAQVLLHNGAGDQTFRWSRVAVEAPDSPGR